MPTFITNFFLGFFLAAEFGQVSMEIFRRGLSGGFKESFKTTLGGVLADFIYLNLAITGIIAFLNKQEILKALWLIGGFVVFYIATKGMLTFKEIHNGEPKKTSAFLSGFLLNFIHPLNLVWWITILGSIIIADINKYSTLVAYLNGSGIIFGVFAWWLLLSVLTSYAKNWFTVKALQKTSLVASCILLGISFWFFYNALTL